MTRHGRLFLSLAAAAALSSCTSLPATLAVYGIKALMTVTNSNETAYGYYDLGRHYQAQSRWEAAEVAYKKALALDERYYEAHNGLGIVYSMQRKPDLAIQHFQTAVAIAPRFGHLHNNLGHAYYLHGRNAEAIASLETALALEPRSPRFIQNLMLAYERGGLTEKAEQLAGTLTTQRARDSAAISSLLEKPRTAPVPVEVSVAQSLAKPVHGLVLRHSDADATLVLVRANVYELRMQSAASPAPVVRVMRQVRGTAARDPIGFRVEVSNGNAVPGMARRVGEHLKNTGFNVVRLTNQLPFTQPVTEIQYSENRMSEAEALASTFRHALVAPGAAFRHDIHVRVVLGRDALDPVALFKPPPLGTTVALAKP
jgi:Tfp pilus assembly protein PilF